MLSQEIRLELDEAKLNAILMELDILHRAVHPEIVEFYGAFFIESCVYYCMEYMDAGSLDKLQGAGVPEDVLARIAGCMCRGLKFLKDDLQIIHRDVKPTNVLVNKKGQVKLCDFGVSGQLEKSLAKTNIGCQSYMAPERIRGESQNNLGALSYTVSSDVWSLGLSMIEIGMGRYPYPPETYSNVFAQLTAIVHGEPPELPGRVNVVLREGGDVGVGADGVGAGNVDGQEEGGEGKGNVYSEVARDWVAKCLVKEPDGRATYAELLVGVFFSRLLLIAWGFESVMAKPWACVLRVDGCSLLLTLSQALPDIPSRISFGDFDSHFAYYLFNLHDAYHFHPILGTPLPPQRG